MHIISYRRMREYSESHADCREVLDNWFKIATVEPSLFTN
jgi:mRNA interferase HigB